MDERRLEMSHKELLDLFGVREQRQLGLLQLLLGLLQFQLGFRI